MTRRLVAVLLSLGLVSASPALAEIINYGPVLVRGGPIAAASIATTGNVGLGEVENAAIRLLVKGLGSDGSTYQLLTRNAAFAQGLSVTDAGTLALSSVYTTCTGLTTAAGVVVCTPSSRRFKNVFAPFSAKRAADGLMSLTTYSFTFKQPEHGFSARIGLMAEDVCAVDERLCVRNPDGSIQNYDTPGMIGLLVAAMRAQQREIEALKAR